MVRDRREAVFRASQMFWDKYAKTLGPIKAVMVVDDPYGEATYTDDIDCRDRLFKLLPEDVIKKIVEDSKGQIVRDEDPAYAYCLKRLKRRRDFGSVIAPNIVRLANGALFYRAIEVPQKGKGGMIIQKRKVKNIRLGAKDLKSAVAEIASRKLSTMSLKKARLKSKSRYLGALAKVARSAKPLAPVTPKQSRPKFQRNLGLPAKPKGRSWPKPKPEQIVPAKPEKKPSAASMPARTTAEKLTLTGVTPAAKALLKKLSSVKSMASSVSSPTPAAFEKSLWATSRSVREGWGNQGPHKVIARSSITSPGGKDAVTGKVERKFSDKLFE